MAWRLARSLEQLRTELNFLWPGRDKRSDGTIGDSSHRATPSDHNPNSAEVVCAYDIDVDLDGTDDSSSPQASEIFDWLRLRPQSCIKYVIYDRRMFSAYPARGYQPFQVRPYTGTDPHTSHLHVSVGVGPDGQSQPPYDDMSPWLADLGEDDDMTPQELRDELNRGTAPGTQDFAATIISTLQTVQQLTNLVNDLAAKVDGLSSGSGSGASLPVKGGTVTVEF